MDHWTPLCPLEYVVVLMSYVAVICPVVVLHSVSLCLLPLTLLTSFSIYKSTTKYFTVFLT